MKLAPPYIKIYSYKKNFTSMGYRVILEQLIENDDLYFLVYTNNLHEIKYYFKIIFLRP